MFAFTITADTFFQCVPFACATMIFFHNVTTKNKKVRRVDLNHASSPNVNHRNQSEGKFEHFGNAFR
nr:MAG TPA: hypothetical protein [Caudoviricetes sp.]